jgi:anthranilate phosphoribosyltransferase
MSIASVIKEVGRGAAGARSLGTELARSTLAQVLAGEVSEIELGALLMALRMKGESLDEICGFLQATHAHCVPIPSDTPVVVIPSYNGSRRLCNLTPLLATLLAQEGMRVLVHGPLQDPTRVTSATVFQDLGLLCLDNRAGQPPASDSTSPSPTDLIWDAWSRHEPAFVSTAFLCPPLQALLDRRWQLGVRNVGHTLAKMLNPVQGARSLRLVNFTHPEFGALMQQWAQREGVDAMLLRGTEGEPVADPRRMPRIDTFMAGQTNAAASCIAHEGVLSELPLLPRHNDAASTAVYVQSVLSGERPAPAPVLRQVELIRTALAALQSQGQRLEKTA